MNAGRIAAYVGLALLGALVGVAGTLVQAAWFPWGILLALGGTAALVWGGTLATRTKLGAAVPAAGWAVAVLLLTVSRPQGDFLFADGAGSYLFLFGGMMTGAVGAALAPTDRPMFDMTAPAVRGGRTTSR